MKINTELCCKRYDFLDKKDPKLSLSELLSGWQYSNHMAFYVNTSWACALFRNNKQHVVLGQKRNCQRVEENGLWWIQRKRWIEVKYLPNGTNAGYKNVGDQLDRCRWMERTQRSATRQISRWSGKDFAWLLLIGKSSMLPSFLNRFSYFMNLWWCLWSFSVDINQYM
jgi:hypothetical protein